MAMDPSACTRASPFRRMRRRRENSMASIPMSLFAARLDSRSSPAGGEGLISSVDGSMTRRNPAGPVRREAHTRRSRSRLPTTAKRCAPRNCAARSGISERIPPCARDIASRWPARSCMASSPSCQTDPSACLPLMATSIMNCCPRSGSEEAAGRRFPVGRLAFGIGSLRRGDFQADAVGVFKEHPSAGQPLGVRNDSGVMDLYTLLADAGFRFSYLLNCLHLEREVVQPGVLSGEPSLALRPQGQEHLAVAAKENEFPARSGRFPEHIQLEYGLIELLGTIEVGHVQANVAGLQRKLSHRVPPGI